MALRSINAPGVEIKEIDRSDYSGTMAGTNVLVAGFANRGQDFVTNNITSRNGWLTTYGAPENEAERYFYKACMEVIDNGGVLHCAKLPYNNEISSDYIKQTYRVSVEGQPLSADPVLSAITNVDKSIQKFFLVTADTQDEPADVVLNLLRQKYNSVRERVLALIADLESGGTANTFAESMNAIDEILAELDTNPDTSRTAKHIQVLRAFRGDIARSSTEIDTGKNILFNNIKSAITMELDSLRDFGNERDWMAYFKHGFVAAKDEAKNKGEKVKALVDAVADNFLSSLQPISYDEQRAKKTVKKANKEGILVDEVVDTGTTNVNYGHGADEASEIAQILLDILRSLEDFGKNRMRHSNVSRMTEEEYEDLFTGEVMPDTGKIVIVDISRTKYGRAIEKRVDDPYMKECVGYLPVITTAANAIYCQQLLATDVPGDGFNIASDIRSLGFGDWRKSPSFPFVEAKDDCFILENDELTTPLNVIGTCQNSYADAYRDSMTMRANSFFPPIFFDSGSKLNRENLKSIGIVVFRTLINRNDSSKTDYEAVEAFVGDLDPTAVNPSTSASTFIDNIVNSQSQFIRVYSNVITQGNRGKYQNCDIGYIHNQPLGVTGIYEAMLDKKISFGGLMDGLNKVFDNNADILEKNIDVVVDAGISNIGQFVKSVAPDDVNGTYYDPTGPDSKFFKMAKQADTANWKVIVERLDTFCRKTRKDCMFVADCPRPFALIGRRKTVRQGRRDSNIDNTIIPLLRYMAAPNTSFGAGYCNWFEETDDFTGNQFWCPPSIRAAGVYINCDLNYNYWDAPAGLTRGLIPANDVAFNPNITQAGNIYMKNWNYAVKYPVEGVVLEGQKTFQTRESAFDRVNVRRLFLRLERYVYNEARKFVYEPNTAAVRQRLVDNLDLTFKSVKIKGGIYDYIIICDETNNTVDTIDRNELRVTIGIKPTKTIEFIIIQFVAVRTGGSWDEMNV